MSEEVLQWLLPGAGGHELAAARRVVTALRLLRHDAGERGTRSADPPRGRVLRELERLERRWRLAAVDALLHAALARLRGPDSFLVLGPAPAQVEDAPRLLGITPAAADEPERWIALGESLGAPRPWCLLARARLVHLRESRERAERGWARLLRGARREGGAALEAACRAGLAALRLERHDPRAVWRGRRRCAASLRGDPALVRLLGWSALLCGEPRAARALLGSLPTSMATLPRSLADARVLLGADASLLAGARAVARGPERPAPLPAEARARFGVHVVAVLVARAGASPRVAWLDAARGSGAGEVAGQPTVPGGLERTRATGAGCLAPGRTRALARVPLPGAPRGTWLQVESEHLLLPATEALAAFARELVRPVVVAERARAPGPPGCPHADGDPRGAWCARLLAALGPLHGLRASWLEPDVDGHPVLRADAGGVLTDRIERPGGARALERALATGVEVRHAGGDDALHASAVAGVVLPLRLAPEGAVRGLLVLEAARRERLDARARARAARALEPLAPAWCAAGFAALRRERTGHALAWPSPLASALADVVPVPPVLLVGAPGSGRRTLARWLAFLAWLRSSSGGACAPVARVLELEALDQRARCALAEADPTTVLVARRPPEELRARGRLGEELASVLGTVVLVPPLRDRRDEIAALAAVLLDDAARSDGLAPPRLADDAVAALWRQTWPRGIPQLREVVAALAHRHPGRTVGEREVRAELLARGTYLARLPSRRPRELDLAQALAATRHRSGRANRARAARYLGWDPGTLAARLREAGPLHRCRREGGGAPVVSLTSAPPS